MPDNSKLVRVQLPKARVLVVDDVEANLEIAKELLEHYGMQVDCLTSGRQAIIRIFEENVSYDAIFMDHMMPELDGIETARIIREEIGTEYAKNIPIIALTANAATGNKNEFIEKGFQAFLSKPIDIIRLDAAVNQWLRNKDLEREYVGNHGRLEQGADASAAWTQAGSVLQGACTATAG
jgi:CheY-like chemotaxis protein